VFDFRFPPSGFSFQTFSVSAFCFVLGFSISYSTRSQSSKVRWVCWWRDVISIRHRTK
jgi:hypothetical protein